MTDFKDMTTIQKLGRIAEILDRFAWKKKAEGREEDFGELIELETMLHLARTEMITKERIDADRKRAEVCVAAGQ